MRDMRPPLMAAMGLMILAILAEVQGGDTNAITGRARVIDGDTLDIGGKRIRLHGIDAPERDQICERAGQQWACGQAATGTLRAKVEDALVSCVEIERDRYGRIVAVCHGASEDVNATMVRVGMEVAYRRYSLDYVGQEAAARQASQGVWAGRFVMLWDWRRGARLAANNNEPGTCQIKGNISRKGERIYHVPGGQWYGRTRIDTGRGERWFCTEAQAMAAGWRKSGR